MAHFAPFDIFLVLRAGSSAESCLTYSISWNAAAKHDSSHLTSVKSFCLDLKENLRFPRVKLRSYAVLHYRWHISKANYFQDFSTNLI
ncbi:unnamed protein product [Acanthoscelides obtectus]|uniref:Secreted protein n=1 Tax=Acanthoscelides obtectus TaxID=200917 RepID=A0A9P0KK95_ACAOB|nr:unnamed protein product [Acanthoscelides obtectus]CAK1653752.1 hypothetical protein AOBTE_LOCUS18351 [Acanthoscelides obtectus]